MDTFLEENVSECKERQINPQSIIKTFCKNRSVNNLLLTTVHYFLSTGPLWSLHLLIAVGYPEQDISLVKLFWACRL
ncbi:hypothetical protein UPYG_G00198710 [Umbra pygmaea]|uniref:Uncharacterized protein n=1 Tax=Umbra pygmaea TaxID=75934 RepID=A0ABD0WMI8_UMBPY